MPDRKFSVKLLQNYIDGRFVNGAREFADVNPADGSIIAQVAEADRATVDHAVAAARTLARLEGIIPALESAHALAELITRAPKNFAT